VQLAVLLQLPRGRENARALYIGALDFARNWCRVQFEVLLQVFCSCAMLTAQLALVTLRVVRRGHFKSEQLFFSETLHHNLQIPPIFDASLQMPLQLHLVGKVFKANLALVIIWFQVGSESVNWISVEKSRMAHVSRLFL
jgi:hypothetical protein